MAKLYFYYSAMNAGKTTTLLQSAHNYEERGLAPLLFTPAVDDRYGVNKITSRIGLQREAHGFVNDTDLFESVSNWISKGPVACVLIDEAQFLSAAQVLQLTRVVDELNVPVLCYGLRTDFRGEPFEGSKYLLAWAEELTEIKTVDETGKKAIMNARLDDDGNQVFAGDVVDIGHHYLAVSRKKFQLAAISPVGRGPKSAP